MEFHKQPNHRKKAMLEQYLGELKAVEKSEKLIFGIEPASSGKIAQVAAPTVKGKKDNLDLAFTVLTEAKAPLRTADLLEKMQGLGSALKSAGTIRTFLKSDDRFDKTKHGYCALAVKPE